jgi:hypothetical protein
MKTIYLQSCIDDNLAKAVLDNYAQYIMNQIGSCVINFTNSKGEKFVYRRIDDNIY